MHMQVGEKKSPQFELQTKIMLCVTQCVVDLSQSRGFAFINVISKALAVRSRSLSYIERVLGVLSTIDSCSLLTPRLMQRPPISLSFSSSGLWLAWPNAEVIRYRTI